MTGADIVVALDKFRGSMTAPEACTELAIGIAAVAEIPVRLCPVADGGEGTAESLIAAGYQRHVVRVAGPDGQVVSAVIAIQGPRAVVELAQAAGIHQSDGRSALAASTYGVGQMMTAALDLGCTELVVALGGSATTDGGAGMLSGLGARLIDRDGDELDHGGGHLVNLEQVDLSGLDPRLGSTSLVLASDVTNPLLGTNGAAAVYAPQKGARPEDIPRLEAGLARLAHRLQVVTGTDVANRAGAGAAGGTGFAAMALGARVESGVEFVLREARIGDAIKAARLVVVGEGSLDSQSLRGKAPVGIAMLAHGLGVPVVAVAGRIDVEIARLKSAGIVAAYELIALAGSQAAAMSEAHRLMREAGMRIAREHHPSSGLCSNLAV